MGRSIHWKMLLVGVGLLGAEPGVRAQVAAPKAVDSAASEPVTDQEFHLPVDPETADEIEALIAKLGSPQYMEREQSTTRLVNIGLKAFALLRAAYRVTDDFEVRLRIENIVYEAFFDEYVYGRSGFLGISQGGAHFPNHNELPLIPEGHIGIVIQQVHPNTAAAKAGLLESDIVIGVDGQPIKASDSPTRSFGEQIRDRGPGGRLVLTVIRSGKIMDVEVTLGRCPPAMVKRGNIQAVTDQFEIASARFLSWWPTHFSDSATLPPNPSDAPTP